MLYAYLRENYEEGEPIFASDIDIPHITEENLRYHLKKLTDDGVICRFEPGIYYLPKTSIWGERMALSADTVTIHKYILRRPIVEITAENVTVLQFLDCLKDIDKCAEEDMIVCGQILSRFAKENGITKCMVDKFIGNYPMKVYKAIYETGVEYVSA